MSLTIDTHDLHTEFAPDQLPAPEQPQGDQPPTVERWLEVMYGIRPDAALRSAFVPLAYPHNAEVAEWLGRMWGITAGWAPTGITVDGWLAAMYGIRRGESSPTTSAGVVAGGLRGASLWLHRLWGLAPEQEDGRP